MIAGTICITGVTGFIGNSLIKSLNASGDSKILAIVRSTASRKRMQDLGIDAYPDDGDTDHLISALKDRNVHTVIHLASLYLKIHQSKQIEELISSNLLFGTRMLEASAKSSVRFFINTGTFWQYYRNQTYSPVNLYAASKQAFEALVRYYRETSEVLIYNIYLNDTYGPGDTRGKILNLWNSMRDTDVLDMSPGEQMINLLHIDDVVEGYLRLIYLVQARELAMDSTTPFCLKGAEEMTLRQLAALFESISNRMLNLRWGALPYKEREIMTVWSGGVPVPGWKPRISLREGLGQLLSCP